MKIPKIAVSAISLTLASIKTCKWHSCNPIWSMSMMRRNLPSHNGPSIQGCLIHVINLIFDCGWLSQLAAKTKNTQNREYTACGSKSPDFQKPRWLPAALTTFFLTTALKAPRHFVEVLEGSPSVEMQQKKHSYVFWKTPRRSCKLIGEGSKAVLSGL